MARSGITLDGLTRAAADLADEVGFEHLTVSAVARRLGVKDPSLYAHISSAHDLKTRVALLALEELADRAAEALAGRAGKDALFAFANAYRDYAHAHPGRYAATRFDLDPETALASAAPRHSALTRSLLRAYPLSEPAQTDAIRFLGAALHGYITLELTGAFSHTQRPTASSWTWTLTALHNALAATP
ncbi:TetR/AcrR family transcriptional regulator [Actinocorallia aurea]